MLEVKEGAVFVADAHYASYRPLFRVLIQKILAKEIITTQLFLMGDIFDLLMGPISAFRQAEDEIILELKQLSQEIEVIYLEGNHDFQLASLFPHMKVFTLKQQPVPAMFQGKEGLLAHGDWGEGFSYGLYSTIIRSQVTLKLLELFDRVFFRKISHLFRLKMESKALCSSFLNFEAYINRKLRKKKLLDGWLIEGHYHQGSSFFVDKLFYHNLEAMACNKSYFVVQSNMNRITLKGFLL